MRLAFLDGPAKGWIQELPSHITEPRHSVDMGILTPGVGASSQEYILMETDNIAGVAFYKLFGDERDIPL